ncbi:lipase family alpha/beta hydrolase [Phytohabitans rumicis]|uniref:lipase family alpha/beta hydrolase n=1 Tax=Phytohabitans rumicis TaxID=1076125 RepID=UPI00156376FF|nr:hypothetical protein [Phytohabitans rumicis]
MVPGIMGSELVDSRTRRTLWGFRDLRWYVRAWTTGGGLTALRLTDEERAGVYGRVEATSSLRFPAFARVLAGLEPYTRLFDTVRAAVQPGVPVVDFAYDWRLPVAHNAGLLAERVHHELRRWHAHPAHDVARRVHPDGRPARVVIVAHSMGGLLARYLSTIPGATDDIRAVVTLGTPFYGSVKAAVLLNAGRGAPFPSHRPWSQALRPAADEGLRRLAASLPGVHDLLPTYRCVNDGRRGQRLDHDTAVALGADPDHARASAELHRRLADAPIPGHRPLVGTHQPTPQSFALREDTVSTEDGLWVDRAEGGVRWSNEAGDGTVYRGAASLDGTVHTYLPQQHGPLAKSSETRAFVHGVITELDLDRLGPPQAALELGLAVPDLACPGDAFTGLVTGVTGRRDATCHVIDAANGQLVSAPLIDVDADGARVAVRLPQPGLFRVEVAGGGYSPVSQHVLAVDPGLADDGADE